VRACLHVVAAVAYRLMIVEFERAMGPREAAESGLVAAGDDAGTVASMPRANRRKFTSLEICAGAGGQAIGLERAKFEHVGLVEYDKDACRTLRANRASWKIHEGDLRLFDPSAVGKRVDLLAGGVPCPPYSIAGKQLGRDDERDLFPEVLRLTEALNPRGLMIENVRGLLQAKFRDYREHLRDQLAELGYMSDWALLNASDFGVPQLRPRSVLVALKPADWFEFEFPAPRPEMRTTVGEVLRESMRLRGMANANEWAERAHGIAPTIVGGSKKHGGADLGPTRAKAAWRALGVDGMGLANEGQGVVGGVLPRLTVQQAALIQGFPPDWVIQGRKTAAYRQVGNAFPPPVAEAVASAISKAWRAADRKGARRTTRVS